MPSLKDFSVTFMRSAVAENRPSEVSKKKQMLRDHLLPAFGHLRLDQITAALVDAYKADKLRTLKPNTVANHVSVLKRMLHVAREWGTLPNVPRIRQVKIKPPERDYLAFDECERFLAAADSGYRPLLLVAVRTGLRLGELRGLQWGDVDLERRRVRVRRAFTQTGWGEPKSGQGRTVDLSWDAHDVLASLRPRDAARTALVFPSPSGTPVDEKAIYKAIYKACARASKQAKLGRVVGPHKLRHTFASHHAMRGTPLPQLQPWMGHSAIATTMRYAHLCPSEGARYADAVAPHRGPRIVHARESRGVTTGVTTTCDDRETAS